MLYIVPVFLKIPLLFQVLQFLGIYKDPLFLLRHGMYYNPKQDFTLLYIILTVSIAYSSMISTISSTGNVN